MSPNQLIALGPGLLPWAREYTNDLNEAHFLVRQTVSRLAGRAGVHDGPIALHRAKSVMSEVARQNGIAGHLSG